MRRTSSWLAAFSTACAFAKLCVFYCCWIWRHAVIAYSYSLRAAPPAVTALVTKVPPTEVTHIARRVWTSLRGTDPVLRWPDIGDEPPAWSLAFYLVPAHLKVPVRVQGQRMHTAVMNRNPRLTHPLLFHSPLSSLCPASNQSKRKGEHGGQNRN